MLFFGHLAKFFSSEEIGGPFVLLFIVLGIYGLKKKENGLFAFIPGWMLSVILLLSFVTLGGRGHLLDFAWPLALLATLGIWQAAGQYRRSTLIASAVLLTLLYSLLLVNHTTWGKLYDPGQSALVTAFSQEISKLDIKDQDVIAVPEQIYLFRLNYLNDKSLVIFKTRTIENLLEENKLAEAFESFGVKYVLGYSDGLSQEILENSTVKNIGTDSIELPEIKTSAAKMWLMNIVR
jgi:hypothetical protein